jgi:hypothetical protein
MAVPYTFGTATAAIPLSQLDSNFATAITIGNTAVQLGNTVTTLNNMTLANVTISSGTITITNVAVTTANVSGTANISTLVVTANASVAGNVTVSGNTVVTGNVTSATHILTGGTTNGVVYLDATKALTTGSALTFDGTNFATTGSVTGSTLRSIRASGSQPEVVLQQTSVASWSIYNPPSSTDLRFYNGSDLLTLNGTSLYTASTINVGIGTSSPTRKLTVVGDATNYGVFTRNPSGYGAFNFSSNTITSQVWSFIAQDNGANSDLLLYGGASGGTKLTIDSSGNLGLGVTPSAWDSGAYKAIQIGTGIGIGGVIARVDNTNQFNLGLNWRYDGGTAREYIASSFATNYEQASGAHAWYTAASGTAGYNITFTQAMTLDASGRLLVGTTSGSGATMLTVNQPTASTDAKTIVSVATGTNAAFTAFVNTTVTTVGTENSSGGSLVSGSSAYSTVIANNGAYPISFGTNNTERARIDSSGNLQVGTMSAGGSKFRVNSTGLAGAFYVTAASTTATEAIQIVKYDNNSTTAQVFQKFYINDGAAACGQINGNGANNAAFGSTSDSRLKENIVDLPSQLSNIMALRPVEFDYIKAEGGGHQIGFVAQEMQAVYSDTVGERKDGMLMVTGWSKTEARLVKAIQEQNQLITTLTARITALEGA